MHKGSSFHNLNNILLKVTITYQQYFEVLMCYQELLLVVNKDIAASGVWKHSQEAEQIENGDLNIMQKEKNKDTILSNEENSPFIV
jgi:hypothetical protein